MLSTEYFTCQILWSLKRPMQSASKRTFHRIHWKGQVIFAVDSSKNTLSYSTALDQGLFRRISCRLPYRSPCNTVIYMAVCLSNEGFVSPKRSHIDRLFANDQYYALYVRKPVDTVLVSPVIWKLMSKVNRLYKTGQAQ